MNLDNSLNIPGKCHYKFHELSAITCVKPYVLRFWETEFSQIAPILDEQGNKLYSQSDIDAVNVIKVLLFDQHLSIPQAKLKLEEINQSLVLGFDDSLPQSFNNGSFEVQDAGMEEVNQQLPKIESPIEKINSIKFQLRNAQSFIDRVKVRQGWELSV